MKSECIPVFEEIEKIPKMNDWIVYIVLLLAQFAGGGFYVIVILYGKNTDTDPMVLVLIRDFFAAVITLILTFISEKKLMIPKRR